MQITDISINKDGFEWPLEFYFKIDGNEDNLFLSDNKVFDWLVTGLDCEGSIRDKFEGKEVLYIETFFIHGPVLVHECCIRHFLNKRRNTAAAILNGQPKEFTQYL